jgi:hypothetical protein
MTGRRFLASFAVIALSCGAFSCRAPAQEPAQLGSVLIGRNGLLRNVHGYDAEGTALVPVRALCEWLGGQVTYANGEIEVTLAGTRLEFWPAVATIVVNGTLVQLRESTREFSGIVCAPVTPLCEALGAKVRYVPGCYAGERPEGADEKWDLIPHVIITQGEREGVILIHQSHPDIVAQIIGDMENTTQVDATHSIDPFNIGTYGVDWVLGVNRINADGKCFISSFFPEWGNGLDGSDPPGFYSDAWGIYGLREGKWRFLIGGNDNSYRKADVRATGISPQTFQQFGFVPSRLDQ